MDRLTKITVISLVFLLFISVFAYSEFYNRAPDSLPGLIPEMRTTAFWVAKMSSPDDIILSVDDIMARNAAYEKRMASPNRFRGIDEARLPAQKDLDRWPGRFIVKPDIESMSPAELAKVIKQEVSNDIAYMRGQWGGEIEGLENVQTQAFGNILGIEYADWELDDMEAEMALSSISAVNIRDAITVCDARLRIVPTLTPESIGMMENGKTRWDVWNVNIVRIGTPVAVLHASRTGGYVFVLSGEGYGWIKTEEVAFDTAAEIDIYANTPNFIICTGDRVPFYSDETCTYVSGWMRMGDRLPLAPGKGNTRIIDAPARRMNGDFITGTAYLKPDADVSVGYLPYTRRNIIETAFKLLDNPYDWTMAWYGRNHETTDRDIFACFGFDLPFNAELFTFYGDNTRVVRPEEGKDAQYKAILANEPFVTIQTCGGGHNQLYLGEYNGEPIVLDTHGYQYIGEDGKEYLIRRLVVGEMSQPAYFLNTAFTFLELK